MKTNVTMVVVSGLFLSATMGTTVLAAEHKPAKMTCEEFLVIDDVAKPKIVYWAEGFNKKGKPINSFVDVEETDKMIPMLITECQEAPKQSLSKAIKKHMADKQKAAPKKSTALHKPGKMTCEQFVELEDVVKPKIVYWAEGFNKKGKPIDSVVDMFVTDKLVPVLVTECKETPKLSFWDKIKKHF